MAGEPSFMGDVLRLFEQCGPQVQEKEMTNWGGWWRNRYREDAGKAKRVLAEVRSMLREGKIRRNPGAAAQDLWKRFAST